MTFFLCVCGNLFQFNSQEMPCISIVFSCLLECNKLYVWMCMHEWCQCDVNRPDLLSLYPFFVMVLGKCNFDLLPDVHLLVLPDTTMLSFILFKLYLVVELGIFWSYLICYNCFFYFLQFPNSINRELNVCKICESWIWIKLCEINSVI